MQGLLFLRYDLPLLAARVHAVKPTIQLVDQAASHRRHLGLPGLAACSSSVCLSWAQDLVEPTACLGSLDSSMSCATVC